MQVLAWCLSLFIWCASRWLRGGYRVVRWDLLQVRCCEEVNLLRGEHAMQVCLCVGCWQGERRKLWWFTVWLVYVQWWSSTALRGLVVVQLGGDELRWSDCALPCGVRYFVVAYFEEK